MFLRKLFVAVSWFIPFAASQTNHVITVGRLGSFYDPPTLSAGPNDTVTFLFEGPFHTVTQSSEANPCLPLPGGFDSGVLGKGTNDTTTPTPAWTITITNASEPIWFFCEITTPTSHCGSGMVGAINPPSQQAYTQFKMAAEAVSGTPTPLPTLVLTGVGAAAATGPSTIPPSDLPTDVQPTTATATVTSTPSSTPVAPAQESTAKAHLGAILGASVGGFFGLVLIAILIIYWMRQRRARGGSVPSPVSDDSHFFDYTPGPVRPRRPSEAFVAAKALESSALAGFPPPGRTMSPDSTTPLSPNRRPSLPLVVAVTAPEGLAQPARGSTHQALDRQASAQSLLGSPTTATDGASTLNMQALANEVAAVLMRSPSGGTLNGAMSGASLGLLGPAQASHLRTESRASGNSHDPPAYRLAGGGPGPMDTGAKANRDRG